MPGMVNRCNQGQMKPAFVILHVVNHEGESFPAELMAFALALQ